MKYASTRVVVDAEQWNQNGDHSLDGSRVIPTADGGETTTEGAFIKRFRRAGVADFQLCQKCQQPMIRHGIMVATDKTVCPGSWIAATPEGSGTTYYTYSDEQFRRDFEPAE